MEFFKEACEKQIENLKAIINDLCEVRDAHPAGTVINKYFQSQIEAMVALKNDAELNYNNASISYLRNKK